MNSPVLVVIISLIVIGYFASMGTHKSREKEDKDDE